MNLNFNDDRLSIICIYQDIRAPLNFAIRGVQQVYVNKYISMEKRCNMTCDFTQQVKEKYNGQDFKVET